jgi:choline dehydrogenase
VLLEGRRANGVEYLHNGKLVKMHARREVIICGGAINSPQILMLSGIGDAFVTKQAQDPHRRRCSRRRPNLQDHLETYVQHACTKPITLYSTQNPVAMGAIGIEWLLFGTGPRRTNHFESGGFIRSRAGVEHPICSITSCPIAITYDGKEKVNEHGFQAHVGPMRATSRGSITLKSSDPHDAPRILFNYLSTEATGRSSATRSG